MEREKGNAAAHVHLDLMTSLWAITSCVEPACESLEACTSPCCSTVFASVPLSSPKGA